MQVVPGDRLGRYHLERRIGAGGMAEVWEAVDDLLRRRVAIKIVRGALAEEEEFTRRFLREARLAAQLAHPHVVPIFDVGVERGAVFVVMPVLTGGTLSDRIEAGSVPDNSAIAWLADLAGALDDAHAKGVVHRDVKPLNVLFDESGVLHLSDFGLAKSLEETIHLTQTGAVLGTPVYMAPEQAMGQPAGPASDQYSLGILAYRLLVGRLPIEKAATPIVLQKTVFETLPPPSKFRRGLPAEVDRVFARVLAKRPEERWPSCREFVAALATALQNVPVPVEALPTTRMAQERSGAPALTYPPTLLDARRSTGSGLSPARRGTPTPVTAAPPPPPPPMPTPRPATRPPTSVEPARRAAGRREGTPPVPVLPIALLGLGLLAAFALAIWVSVRSRLPAVSGAGGPEAAPTRVAAALAAVPTTDPGPPRDAPTAPPTAALPPPDVEVFASPAPSPQPEPLPTLRVAVATPLADPYPRLLLREESPVATPAAAPPPTAAARALPPTQPALWIPPTWPPTPTPPPAPTAIPAAVPARAPEPTVPPRPTVPEDPLAELVRRGHGPKLRLDTAKLEVTRKSYVLLFEFTQSLDSAETTGAFATLAVSTRSDAPLLPLTRGLAVVPCEGLDSDEVRCEIPKAATPFDTEDEELTDKDKVTVRGVLGGFLFTASLPVDD